jgi:hypothetical protein
MRLSRIATLVVACVLAGLAASCRALAQEAIAARFVEDQEKVRAFEGTLVERGTVPGDAAAEVVSRVRYAFTTSVRVDALSPADYAGDVFAYDGATLHVYSRRRDAELRVRNLLAPDAAARRAHTTETVAWNLDNYGYREADSETVAGRIAVPWTVTPRSSGDLRLPSWLWLDAEFLVPLRARLGALYEMRYTEARFNLGAPAAEAFRFEPPETAARIDVDLLGPALTGEEARARADFPLLEPREEVLGLARTRIVKASPALFPVLCLRYERAPFHATVLEQRARGLADPKGRGIPVDLDGDAARVSLLGSTTAIVTFARAGVEVTLWTNLPLAAATRFARSLAPAAAAPEPAPR